MERFAFPLPMTVVADLLGVPREDMPRVKAWHDDWMVLFTPGAPLARQLDAARSVVAYQRYYAALIEDRRARPRDDLTTALAEARVEGESFTMAEMISHMMILLSAGHETTTSLVGHLVMQLLRQPEQWRAIDAEPGLMGPAIEEAVRFYSPVQMEPRVTTQAVELGGVSLPRGARLHLLYGAANRDPEVFPDPDRYDIRREHPTRHVGFGWGIHFCIGAPLARLETRVALEVLRERLPGLRTSPGFAPEYVPDFYFRHLKHLKIAWDPPGAGA
jgi:cytochrome P450